MWHVSASAWTRDGSSKMLALRACELAGIRLLTGVGNEREWWWHNSDARVGHLRVGVTEAEMDVIGRWPAESDAGESGPERARTILPV